MAQQKEIAHHTLADLDLDASVLDGPLSISSMREPQTEGEPTIFEGSAEESASQLATVLRDRGVGQS